MKTDLEQASQEMIGGMTFFLTVVIPCVCPEITARKDLLAALSHVEKFGGGWKHEMATGLLVLSEFSNTKNLEHNAGLHHEDSENAHAERAPVVGKKKRKRLHTAAHRDNLHSVYYKMIEEMKEVECTPGFSRQMNEWDSKCWGETNRARRRGPEDRLNVVPLAHRGGASNDNSYFNSFIQGNPNFSDIFSNITNVSPLSQSGPPENDATIPITQQSPFSGTPV
jgi:hypothetical protein